MFSAAIEMVGNAASLEADFELVTEQNKSSFRFFRVDVELP